MHIGNHTVFHIGGTCCNIAPCSGNGGAACFGTGLNPSNYGHARIGGSVVEIGGVCGADNNSTSAGCVGASGCSGGAAGNCTGGGSGLIRNRVNSCTFSLIYLYILYY